MKVLGRLFRMQLAASVFLCRRVAAMNYVYMLRCGDGSLYTGWTNDIEKRVRAHNEGRGAKYTKSRRPVELVYMEKFQTKEEAMSREYHIKRMSREEKKRLIAEYEPSLSDNNCDSME